MFVKEPNRAPLRVFTIKTKNSTYEIRARTTEDALKEIKSKEEIISIRMSTDGGKYGFEISWFGPLW